MIITRIEAFEVTVPIEAPIRHCFGIHSAFTRTVVKVHGADGRFGLGETAASAQQVEEAGSAVVGLDTWDLNTIRMRISQRFYWSRNALSLAAIEMGCLDLSARESDIPAHRLLGGAIRERVDLAAYCFYRYPGADTSAVDSPESMARHAQSLVERYGFGTVKLKAGVLHPDVEVETIEAIRDRLGPGIRLRIDPNASWTPSTAMRYLKRLEDAGLEYLEDPAPHLSGMAAVRAKTRLPLATNMVVTDFAQLAAGGDGDSVDIVLSDPWYWGGPTQTQQLARCCEVLGLGLGMHSGIELGIGMAAMAHTAVTLPNLGHAVDAHYHHATDDVIKGERLLPMDGSGAIVPPAGPGWGVELDEDKVARYRALHDSGNHGNVYVTAADASPDPYRPDWYPVMPAW